MRVLNVAQLTLKDVAGQRKRCDLWCPIPMKAMSSLAEVGGLPKPWKTMGKSENHHIF